MDHHHHQSQTSTARRSLKRKLEQQFTEEEADQVEADRKILIREPQELQQDLANRVLAQVKFLNSSFPSSKSDRAAAKRAVSVLCELAKNGNCFSRIAPSACMPVHAYDCFFMYSFYFLPFFFYLVHMIISELTRNGYVLFDSITWLSDGMVQLIFSYAS